MKMITKLSLVLALAAGMSACGANGLLGGNLAGAGAGAGAGSANGATGNGITTIGDIVVEGGCLMICGTAG